jgi:hypothetical protein
LNYKELQKLNEIIERLKATPNADENIQFVLDLADCAVKIETLEELMRNGNTTKQTSKQKQDEQAKFGLHFTNEEIRQMPKTFRKEFRAEGCTAHIRKRSCGKQTFTYEIRYRRNGYNITITDKNLEKGKQRFIEALKTAEKSVHYGNIPYTFHAFSNYYFQKFRIHKVTPETFKKDMFPKYKIGLQIDRIDNNKGYEKDNCRWVTPKENARNRRNNTWVTINGVRKLATEWSRNNVSSFMRRHRYDENVLIEGGKYDNTKLKKRHIELEG